MTLRVLAYCAIGGCALTLPALGGGHFVLWWLSGALLAAAFVPVAVYGPKGVRAQFGAIAPALALTSVFCTWTEAVVFVPLFRAEAVANLVGASVTYLLFAAAVALLAAALKLHRPTDGVVPHRPPLATAVRVLACGCAYAVYYLIFGAITFQFFTHDFYPEATEQVARLGGWFWAMQIGRGILMTLSVLPIVYTLRMSRGQAALAVGAILWVAGGLALLIVPSSFMGAAQRMIHTVEILTQNVPLGATIVLLMRPGRNHQTFLTRSVAINPARRNADVM
jgi:hypothetical protein